MARRKALPSKLRPITADKRKWVIDDAAQKIADEIMTNGDCSSLVQEIAYQVCRIKVILDSEVMNDEELHRLAKMNSSIMLRTRQEWLWYCENGGEGAIPLEKIPF